MLRETVGNNKRLLRVQGRRLSATKLERQVMEVPGVRSGSIVECLSQSGERKIVAFIQSESGLYFALEDLLGIPVDEVVHLSSLPLMSDGTVDHAALSGIQIVNEESFSIQEFRDPSIHGIRDSALVYEELYDFGEAVEIDGIGVSHAIELRNDRGPDDSQFEESEIPAYVLGPPLLEVPSDVCTLPESLRRAAKDHGLAECIFVDSDGERTVLTYAALLNQAERLAAHLQQEGVRVGDPVLVMSNRHQDFVTALWGTLLAGGIAVPVTAPKRFTRSIDQDTIRRIWETAGRPSVLTSIDLTAQLSSFLEGVMLHDIAAALSTDAQFVPVDIDPSSGAVILFTSGSTGMPKGVVQTHSNVLNKQRVAVQHCKYRSEDKFLNWLAIEHVAGLIHSHLLPIYIGASQVQVQVDYVVTHPTRWLDIITDEQISITWAPNSMLALLADAVVTETSGSWNLESVRRWINAGEQVHFRTCQRLLESLSAYGLNASVIKPAWGMSETCNMIVASDDISLAVNTGVHFIRNIDATGRVKFGESFEPGVTAFVECGNVYPGTEVRVVDEHGRVLLEGQIGRFQIRGVTILSEYYNNPEANQRSFTADGWFDAGDNAFIWNRRVTFTSRDADRIIINGLNLQNVDIESQVETVPGVLPTFTAACAIRTPHAETDSLAVFFVSTTVSEVELDEVCRAVQIRLREEFSLTASYLIPINEDDIPKTNIGKIQRGRLVTRFANGDFSDRVRVLHEAETEPASAIPPWFFSEGWIRANVAAASVGIIELKILGEDALASSELAAQLRARLCPPKSLNEAAPLAKAVLDVGLWRTGWDEPEVYQLFDRLDSLVSDESLSVVVLTAALGCASPRARALLGALEGFAATRQTEHPNLRITWCQMELSDEPDLEAIENELRDRSRATRVKYEGNARLVRNLVPVGVTEQRDDSPLIVGGRYLVTGGLGGVGLKLCAWLSSRYRASLVIVGRLPEELLSEERRRALADLRQSSEVTYVKFDLSRVDAGNHFTQVLREAGVSAVDFAFHLAGLGSFDIRSLDQSANARSGLGEGHRTQCAVKVNGLFTVSSALGSDVPLVAFSSVNSYFGGAGFAEYASANSALNRAVEELRNENHTQTRAIAWSAWNGIGMSKNGPNSSSLARRGFAVLDVDQALESLLLCFQSPSTVTYVGLLGGSQDIASNILQKRSWRIVPTLFYEADTALPDSDLKPVSTYVRLRCVARLPRRQDGRIDIARLGQTAGETRNQPDFATGTERRLAAVWQELLGLKGLMPSDDFFMLGGHSLTAARLGNAIRKSFGVEVGLHEIFTAPVLAAMAKTVDDKLTLVKDDLRSSSEIEQIPRTKPGLTHAQKRIFFGEVVERDIALYNIVSASRLSGEVEALLLERSLRYVTNRHESLRTAYIQDEGVPRLELSEKAVVTLEQHFLSGIPGAEQMALVDEIIASVAACKYDLSQVPLAHYSLINLGPADNILVLSHHHIASDGWSIGVFMRDLSVVYTAIQEQEIPELPQLPTKIAMRLLELDRVEANDKDYWDGLLKPERRELELPLDRTRPVVQSFSGDTLFLELSVEETARVSHAARTMGITVSALLGAVYTHLLSRLSGQREFLFGVPAMRRDHAELSDVVGMLVNTLPCLSILNDSENLSSASRRFRDAVSSAVEHQHYPFDLMVAEHSVERALDRPALISALYNYVPQSPQPSFGKATLSMHPVRHRVARFDLSLHVYESRSQLVLAFEYPTGLLNNSTVERWRDYFSKLLTAALTNPGTPLSVIELMSDAERSIILAAVVNERSEPLDKSIVDVFRSTAHRFAGHTAIVDASGPMTYQELDSRTDTVAAVLQDAGLRAGDRVSIIAEKTTQTMIAILATLKAGGSYLLLDPDTPLLVQEHSKHEWGIRWELAGSVLIQVDRDGGASAQAVPFDHLNTEAASPLPRLGADAEACVMFTSGTTGKPKGVAIANRSVVGLVHRPDWIRLDENTRVLQTGTLTSEACTFEIWAPLLNGGSLIMTRGYGILDETEFRSAIEQHRPTLLWLSKSMFHKFAKSDSSLFHGVVDLIVGGNSVSVNHAASVLRNSLAKLYSVYGPAENTTFTTVHKISDHGFSPVAIGRPIIGKISAPLDDRGQLVPHGVRGELYVGGEGLAIGYVGPNGLTEERFSLTPAFPGIPLYRTGDYVSLDAGGELRHHGRTDDQVIIRGHNLELGTVQSALSKLANVYDSCVYVDGAAASVLVAHVAGEGLRSDVVLETLKTMLPAYAIPSLLYVHQELPLESNGKVDVATLKNSVRGKRASELVNEAATEWRPFEREIAAAFERVLSNPSVVASDSFFALGGDSLMTIKLVDELRKQGLTVDPKQVFLTPEVRSLAAALDRRGEKPDPEGGTPHAHLVRLSLESGTGPDVILAPPAGGTVLGYIELARHLHRFGTLYGIEAPGLGTSEQAILPSFEEMVDYCFEASRPVVADGAYLGGHSLGGHIAYRMAQQFAGLGVHLKGLIVLDTPPDLAAIPMQDADMSEDDMRLFILAMGIGSMLNGDRERLQALPYQDAKRELLAKAREDDQISKLLDETYLDKYLQLQMHQLMYSREVVLPKPRLDIPIYVFRTMEHTSNVGDLFQHWSRYTNDEVYLVDIPGDHASMMRTPNVVRVGTVLDDHCGEPRMKK